MRKKVALAKRIGMVRKDQALWQTFSVKSFVFDPLYF